MLHNALQIKRYALCIGVNELSEMRFVVCVKCVAFKYVLHVALRVIFNVHIIALFALQYFNCARCVRTMRFTQ